MVADKTTVAADVLSQHQRKLSALGSRQSGHLCNLALATLKYLILQGKSDSVRLQAAKQLLELAPVQAKLQAMAARVATKRITQRPEKRNQDGFDQLLKFIEEGGESAQNLVLEMLKSDKNLQ